jgi:hypothetical protein
MNLNPITMTTGVTLAFGTAGFLLGILSVISRPRSTASALLFAAAAIAVIVEISWLIYCW